MILSNLLPIISLLLTTMVVPLLIFLIKRRPELRQTNATTDSTLVATSGMIITQLEGQIRIQDARIATIEETRAAALSDCARALDVAHAESQRTAVIIAQLRTDLDIAARQIDELRIRRGT